VIYKPFSVVKVPFPFTDQKEVKKRPALVLSSAKFQQKNGHVTLAMITTAKKSSWWGDCSIQDLASTGLKVPSIVRQKIFTLDCGLILGKLGALSAQDERDVIKVFRLTGVIALD